jgi:hypothetical protein
MRYWKSSVICRFLKYGIPKLSRVLTSTRPYFIIHNFAQRSVRTPDTISLSRSGSALHRHERPRGDERLVMSNERIATPWFSAFIIHHFVLIFSIHHS